jgi:hypothetical protein
VYKNVIENPSPFVPLAVNPVDDGGLPIKNVQFVLEVMPIAPWTRIPLSTNMQGILALASVPVAMAAGTFVISIEVELLVPVPLDPI